MKFSLWRVFYFKNLIPVNYLFSQAGYHECENKQKGSDHGMTIKIQRFYATHRKLIVLVMTIGILLAEASRATTTLPLYQFLMLVVAFGGLVPVALTAISSLRVKLVSIDVLITIAVVGALLIGEYNEAAIVTWLFLLGEMLEEASLARSRSAVKTLTQAAPQTAIVLDKNDQPHKEEVDFVAIGSRVLVKTGDQVPVDGLVVDGSGMVNEASITGEAAPINKRAGAKVSAGTILTNGILTVKATAVGDDTTFGKIIELVEEAEDSQTRAQRFIDRFAKYYTPLILLVALGVGIITRDLRLAITVMVLGCPGALVIGIPASTVAGIGNGAKHGILFKGSVVMDELTRVDTIAFDKTGTLTNGQPTVSDLIILRGKRQAIIDHAVAIERNSNHPLATAIAKLTVQRKAATAETTTIKGRGTRTVIDGHQYFLGNLELLADNGMKVSGLEETISRLTHAGKSVAILARDDQQEIAVFGISDQLRSATRSTLRRLKQLGINHLVMLTGDNQQTAARVAEQLPIDEVRAAMLPQDKATYLKQLQSRQHHVVFVGDGVNDSPALAQADVAVAMGSGTDVAIDVSDLVLVKGKLDALATGVQLAQRTMNNMKQNIAIALLTVILLFIGLFAGYIEMASGMLIHELSILLVVLNSLRLIRK